MKIKNKKRKLKKGIKIILVLLIIVCVLSIIVGIQQHKIDCLELKQIKDSKEIHQLKVQVEREKRLTENPKEAYALRVKEILKQEKLNHWIILQTDERFRSLPYGWGPEPTLEVNGCVIDALAMVDSWIQNREISPKEILKWSKNTYFTDQGTAWSIFKDFASKFGYQYKDLGNDLENTIPYLEKDVMIIASAQPGIFTFSGHAIVLTHYDKNGFRLLDPNDDPTKKHSLMFFSKEELETNLVHYWMITKN